MFKYSKQAPAHASMIGRATRDFIYKKYLAGYTMEEISDATAIESIVWRHPDEIERVVDEMNLAKNIW